MSNMIPDAIADGVSKILEASEALSAESDIAEDIKGEYTRNAIARNTGAVNVVSKSNAESALDRIGSLLVSWSFNDRTMINHVDGMGARAYYIAEKIKAACMDLAQRYANLEKQLAAAEASTSAAQERLREHSSSNENVRKQILNLTGGRCFYCDVEVVPYSTFRHAGIDREKELHIDHIVPKSSGGPDHISNYVPSCAKCNYTKGSMSFLEFVKLREQQHGDRALKVIDGGAA